MGPMGGFLWWLPDCSCPPQGTDPCLRAEPNSIHRCSQQPLVRPCTWQILWGSLNISDNPAHWTRCDRKVSGPMPLSCRKSQQTRGRGQSALTLYRGRLGIPRLTPLPMRSVPESGVPALPCLYQPCTAAVRWALTGSSWGLRSASSSLQEHGALPFALSGEPGQHSPELLTQSPPQGSSCRLSDGLSPQEYKMTPSSTWAFKMHPPLRKLNLSC